VDVEYWENYYKKNNMPFAHSTFAQYVESFIEDGDTIIELGCGNGRDSVFFAETFKSSTIYALDQCGQVLDTLEDNFGTDNISFIQSSFTNSDIAKLDFKPDTKKHAYSRFTLHSITEEEEDYVINWVKTNINGYFFIEARSDRDFDKHNVSSDHYRRFINMQSLIEKLIENNFKIQYCEESNNFSKYDNSYNTKNTEIDPVLIRLIVYT